MVDAKRQLAVLLFIVKVVREWMAANSWGWFVFTKWWTLTVGAKVKDWFVLRLGGFSGEQQIDEAS